MSKDGPKKAMRTDSDCKIRNENDKYFTLKDFSEALSVNNPSHLNF